MYHWAKRHGHDRIGVVKGSSSAPAVVRPPRAVDANHGGKRIRRGIRPRTVGTHVTRGELYGWLRVEPPTESEPYPIGWVHFPEYDEEHFRQLAAEELVSTPTAKGT